MSPDDARADAARDRAAAQAARQTLRMGLERIAHAARSAPSPHVLADAARTLATAPGTVAVHALPDALVAVRLVRNALPGLPAAATLAIDVLLEGGRIHLRRHGLLVISAHALDRISERVQAEPRLADWCAAALPAVAGLAASWPDGAACCPFGGGLLLGSIGPAPTLEDGAMLSADGPDDIGLKPLGRAFVGRTWIPEPLLVPAQVHLLRRLRRWSDEGGVQAAADLCGPLLPPPWPDLQALARSRAWRRCPQPA